MSFNDFGLIADHILFVGGKGTKKAVIYCVENITSAFNKAMSFVCARVKSDHVREMTKLQKIL